MSNWAKTINNIKVTASVGQFPVSISWVEISKAYNDTKADAIVLHTEEEVADLIFALQRLLASAKARRDGETS